ncbi:hypothetical protein, partial [Bacillus cereus]
MSFVDIRTYCNNYLNAQIKNLGGTSAGSIIYNPDYVFTDKVKGIQQDNPITNVDVPLDYTTPYYPIENGQNVPVDRTIKISDPRLTALVLTSKTSFSTGASVEQQLQLNLDISGKLSGGVGAGVGYSLKIQTTAKTELSQEKSETTTIKTGVPDQDFVKTLPPNYKGKYAIQFYKTE